MGPIVQVGEQEWQVQHQLVFRQVPLLTQAGRVQVVAGRLPSEQFGLLGAVLAQLLAQPLASSPVECPQGIQAAIRSG